MRPGPEEPGDQKCRTRTQEPEPGAVDPEGKTGTQTRTDRAPRLEKNQVWRGRDLRMTTDQKNGQRQVKEGRS